MDSRVEKAAERRAFNSDIEGKRGNLPKYTAEVLLMRAMYPFHSPYLETFLSSGATSYVTTMER